MEEYNRLVVSTPKNPAAPMPVFTTPVDHLGPRIKGIFKAVKESANLGAINAAILKDTKPKIVNPKPMFETSNPNISISNPQLNLPKLPIFSGGDEPQKGEVEYEGVLRCT
jgi:hypothetical protein